MTQGIIFDWIGTLYTRDGNAMNGAERVLETLQQKYRLGLISLAKEDPSARMLEVLRSGLKGFFKVVLVDKSKTAEQYLRCMKEMGTTPQTTAIVDDRTVRGIQIGNQLGCKTYWIQRREYAHELPNEETGEPTARINSIEDLLELL